MEKYGTINPDGKPVRKWLMRSLQAGTNRFSLEEIKSGERLRNPKKSG
jgi:hypothetical protein